MKNGKWKTPDDDPKVLAALQKQGELRTQAREVECRIEKLKAESQLDTEAGRAEKLLRTGELPAKTLDSDLEDAHDRLRVLRKAVPMQERVIENTKSEVAAVLIRQFEPEAKKAVKKVATVAVDLEHAIDEAEKFFKGLGLGANRPTRWDVNLLVRVDAFGGNTDFTARLKQFLGWAKEQWGIDVKS